jgi:acetyl esterase/lipase
LVAGLSLAPPLLAAEPKAHLDISYAEPKSQARMLDVYTSTNAKSLPVAIWIHGGGFSAGDKKEVHQKPQAFADRGFVFVSINDRLLPGHDDSTNGR